MVIRKQNSIEKLKHDTSTGTQIPERYDKGNLGGKCKGAKHDSNVKQILFLMGIGVYPAPAGVTFFPREKSNK